MTQAKKSDEEIIRYQNAVWKDARFGVIIGIVIHFIVAVLMIAVAQSLTGTNFTLVAAPMIFNWWVSKMIVKVYAEKHQVNKPFRVGILASCCWIVFTMIWTSAYIWYEYTNN
jgi:hypothetical protein